MANTFIIIKFQLEGFHAFPAAADIFPEVSFLAERHRHIFHFECKKKVNHDDRDVEFILFKRSVVDYLINSFGDIQQTEAGALPFYRYCEFGSMSCEMIAKQLLEHFDLESCLVSEDGENGAIIEKA